jgi:signal transduction histidine kinase
VVPASAWSAHGNRLFVLVKAESPADGRIGSLAVGPEADLLWAWRWRVAWGQTLPQFVAVASGLLAAVMAAVWLRRRHEVGHAALAVACTAFALHAGSALWEEPPLGATAWDSWILLTAMALAGASLALATRLADAPLTRRAQAGLAALAALATIVGGLDAGLRAHAVAFAWLLLAICGLWLAGKGLRKGDGRLFAPGAALAVAGGFDALGIDPALPALPWAMAVLFAAAAWTLLMRFVETLNAAELLNIDLEALVQSRTAELRTQFERVAELERRQTVAAERERLMRDMHDGVGGHLVSLLAMIEGRERPPQELALAVRDALDDMRLVIDSLEPVDDDLNAVLAMWRDRLAPRLSQLGVTLDWDVELLPQLPGLTPARVLHVLRILQEAVTNAVRHGRAATVRVRAAADDAALHITLHDDGGGFDAAHGLGRGRGLTNMQRRAELAGAVLLLDSASGRGTTVSLRLPLRGLS